MEVKTQSKEEQQRHVANRFKKSEAEKLALKKAKSEHKKLIANNEQ